MEGIPALDFIKENKAWCAVLAVCLVLLALYAGWYFTHPRLTFVTNCDAEVDQMMFEFPMMADYAVLDAGKETFFLTHGHLWNEYRLPPLG